MTQLLITDLIFFAIIETGRDNFSAPFLNNLTGRGVGFSLVLPTSTREIRGHFGGF
jgi:hypothetical protein